MARLQAWNAWGQGFNMSRLYNGLGFIPPDPSVTTTYLGALDANTVAYELTGTLPVRYLTLSGTVNLITGDVLIDDIYWIDGNFKYCITWDDAGLLINAFDDFSGGAFASLLLGNDVIYGNSYRDLIKGGNGNDKLYGIGGNDTLYGEFGGDTLSGGQGNDFLIGGSGLDKLIGGAGTDVFDFNKIAESPASMPDVVSDFRPGIDIIDLSNIDSNAGKGGNQAFTRLTVRTGFDGLFDGRDAGPNRLHYDPKSDVLYGNTDSDATPEFAIRIILNGQIAPSLGDFAL